MPRSCARLQLGLVAVVVLLPAPAPLHAGTPPPEKTGFVSEARVAARALEYLEYATVDQSDSILNAIAHMERDAVDPSYTAPVGVIDVGSFARIFEKLELLLDTRDFDGLYLLNALLGYEDHPYLTPAMWDQIRSALLSFKFWYVDPTPPMPDPSEPLRDWDDSYYWTENHQILYHAIEFLAGQRFPDECFWIFGFERTKDCTGPGEMLGSDHMARARGFIMRWLDERWQYGYSEWHSNIYYQKDATPLLTLVEYAQDEEIRTRAAMLLDLLLLDLATHTHRDVLGVTHGRSEMKDTYSGPVNDTWGLVHLLFGEQDEVGYASRGDAGATLFARAKRYRMPQPLLEAAHEETAFADRSRMGVWLDESAPISEDPEHPPGHDFSDSEENFTFWWGIGAFTAWQVVPLSVINGDRYNLWETSNIRDFSDLRTILGEPPNIAFGQQLAQANWATIAVGLLKEMNSYTWRTQDYILSTAQDYRKGANAAQVHAWQATIDTNAMVFTTHPMNGVQPPVEWIGSTDGQPGYWSGTASMPRSAQFENVAIHIYSPRYVGGEFFGFFDYQDLTHAYFPQDHFEEVVQSNGWTIGRRRAAYVAVYSWRPTTWQPYTPEELAPLPPSFQGPITRSFDLVADGGADNVWIVECAQATDWSSFEAFVDAITAASVVVTPHAGPTEGIDQFDVEYESPSQGDVGFGFDAPFTVDGQEIALAGYPRIDNPWLTSERGDPVAVVSGVDSHAILDWKVGTRVVALPEPSLAALGLAGLAALAGLRSARRRP